MTTDARPGDGPPLLRAEALHASLSGGRELRAEFALRPGQCLRVTGPSGAGKTTLLRILARLAGSGSGEVFLRGEPRGAVPAARWRRDVVLVAQRPVMLPGDVSDNLRAGFRTRNAPEPPPDLEDRIRKLLEELGLDPGVLDTQDAATLSGGEAARVALARALLVGPPVLLCDEPTAALDANATSAVVDRLGRFTADGGALVVVAHQCEALARLAPMELAV